MKIDCLILGAYQTNCYVLRKNNAAKDCLIVDAGLGGRELIDFLQQPLLFEGASMSPRKRGLNPVAVILTHGHIDHIAAVTALRKNYPQIKVYIHKLDAEMLTEPLHNLSALAGRLFRVKPADFLIEDKSIIEHAGIKLTVLHTPGHTPGGICLYSQDEGIVFTDDTLFAESVGRTDFPGGSMDELIKSINEKLLTLPDETKVYPGHGPTTTIARERAHNPFLK
jgi:glyoxylase-like metal-dependent hydrolase (beta-lactamase superfamily II)